METHTSIATRLVIWLMVITMPVQSLPAANCGCAGSSLCNQVGSQTGVSCGALSEQPAGTCCCSKQQATSKPTCCSQGREDSSSQCECGENCRCGQTQPNQPSTPIPQETPTEKVAQDANAADGMWIIPAPITWECHHSASSQHHAWTALDRCAALCRFTL